MRYSLPSKYTTDEMASMCRSGRCPVKSSAFQCPFTHEWPFKSRWPENDPHCNEVTAEMWEEHGGPDSIPNPEDEARQDMIHYLARRGAVQNLLKELSDHDIINRMSLEGELHEIESRLQELKREFPKAMADVLKG